MFGIEQRQTKSQRPQTEDSTPFVDAQLARSDPEQERDRRHGVLMECLNDERDRQQEERIQAAIDEDFYDHLQWRQEDAAVLIERGQAPLVFNEARQTIDWLSGMEKRMRKDYKILPREQGDEKGAEVKTQVVKYTDDVNLTQWHRSKAFKQACLSGLSWLEEGINVDPEEEQIFSGSEDWRNVYRDSRCRNFALQDARYLFRRKCTDLDYALALLPKAGDHLRQIATSDETVDDDDVWYLGERLTGASDILNQDGLPSNWRDRRAYVGNDYADKGRRTSVELLECWYRVPESVKVFDGGPLSGKVVNLADYRHQQLQNDGAKMYQAVKMRMRVMVATKDQPLWDGPSPFKHGRFLLVPIWGYRRYRDGMAYGVMRGMRDLQEDVNKRASKALWLLSSNRVVADQNAVEDVEVARQEAARADGWITKRPNSELRFEKPMAEVQGNLEMMERNVATIRNIGGVTPENLGRGPATQSGIAIERKQDQGSLTTSELFDNKLLATKIAGQLRVSHIEQFMTEKKAIRILGEGKPLEWLTVNDTDPDTGEMVNDLTAQEADFIVSEQDYRESYARAALEQMMELLGQIATYAPQVVMAVLDLVVDSAEIKNKDEWISRIRKLNGQRDPTKEVTPEEQAQQFAEAQKAALQDKMAMQQLALGLKKLEGEISKLDADAITQRVNGLLTALQAAQIVAVTPAVAPVADVIAQGAGFKDHGGQDPNIPAAAQPTAPTYLGNSPDAAPQEQAQPAPMQPPGMQQAL
jgi:hypothetical protein